MRVAALDLGSNTFLMLIAEVQDGKLKRILRDESRAVRLGQDIHRTREFHPEALARAEECFAEYRKIMNDLKVEKVFAAATSAARDASNKQAFFTLGKKYQIPIEVIPGEREAAMTFMGATFSREQRENLAVIDIGGGSTEIIYYDGKTFQGKSLDMGSVRLTEMFIGSHPTPESECQKVREFVRTTLSSMAPLSMNWKVKELVAVAGTPTNLAAMEMQQTYDDQKVEGFHLPLSRISSWSNRLAGMSVQQRQELIGIEPKRADVLLAGTLILDECCRFLNVNEITVSTKGVRYGLALGY